MIHAVHQDMSAAWMVLQELNRRIADNIRSVGPEDIALIEGLLRGRHHAGRSRAYFLYREAALGLAAIMSRSHDPALAAGAAAILRQTALSGLDDPCMAASEALGTLPLFLCPPSIPLPVLPEAPHELEWDALLRLASFRVHQRPAWSGRSLIASNGERVLVLKCARKGDAPDGLLREALWMERFATLSFPAEFEIPVPVRTLGGLLFSIVGGLPGGSPGDPPDRPDPLDPRGWAIAYTASKGYFGYPNDERPGRLLPAEELVEVLRRNAVLMGRIASMGVVHTAPVPLFHNRTQQGRRDDGGLYLWQRMGRLDRWLDSCRYPNFGCSGLRDFEHLERLNGSGLGLFRALGLQILSLFLVTGSYFRSKRPELRGLQRDGSPVDARGLFDPDLLHELLRQIVDGLHQGFVGVPLSSALPPLGTIVERMIEEMGVDRHMTEILRIPDQQRMSRARFEQALQDGGIPREETLSMAQGSREILLNTGPHLGEFNGPISLPELVQFTASVAGCLVSSRFLSGMYDSVSPS
jgi:hypothetical protein